MTILSVVQNVSLAIGIQKPDVVMTSTEREVQELVQIANDMAIQIRDAEFDWQALQKVAALTGDGIATDWDLPSDYARMTTKAGLRSSRWTWGLEQITSIDNWLDMLASGFVPVTGQWALFGDQLHILPIMQSTETIKFSYISNLIVRAADGTLQTTFSKDDDTFRLNERALQKAIIWAWRSQKGQASDEDENEFNRALYTAMNNDKGSKPVVSGNARRGYSAKTAFPYRVGN